jgi:peptidylprolyl isomerase
LLIGALVLLASACSGSVSKADLKDSESVLTGLTVSGRPGSAPTVRMRTPLNVDETVSGVTVTGTGAPIQVEQLFVLELTLYDARTGKLATSTYATGTAIAAKTSGDTLFPKLSDALVGVRQGSRLVLAATAADAFATGGVPPAGVRRDDPVVVVADVVAVPPTTVLTKVDGMPVSHVPFSPYLVFTDGVATGLDVVDVRWPRTMRAYTEVVGKGPVVRYPSIVTVDYIAQRRKQQDPFEDTFFKEPEQVAIGTGTAPPAWDKFLVGVRRGSRLVIYGPDKDGMIAWVVDVLGVS